MVIGTYGVPEIFISDSGIEFVNSILQNLAETLHIKHVDIFPYRSGVNGLVERANRKILEALRCTVGG